MYLLQSCLIVNTAEIRPLEKTQEELRVASCDASDSAEFMASSNIRDVGDALLLLLYVSIPPVPVISILRLNKDIDYLFGFLTKCLAEDCWRNVRMLAKIPAERASRQGDFFSWHSPQSWIKPTQDLRVAKCAYHSFYLMLPFSSSRAQPPAVARMYTPGGDRHCSKQRA